MPALPTKESREIMSSRRKNSRFLIAPQGRLLANGSRGCRDPPSNRPEGSVERQNRAALQSASAAPKPSLNNIFHNSSVSLRCFGKGTEGIPEQVTRWRHDC